MKSKKSRYEIRKPESLIAVGTLLVGIVVAIIYAFQLNAMLESNKINGESLHSVQRAFISFQQFRAIRKRVGDSGHSVYEFYVVHQNSGTTPALVMATSFGAKSTDEPSDEEFAGKADFTSVTYGPKAEQLMGPAKIASEEELFGMSLGNQFENFSKARFQKNFVIWSWIAYRDIFPKSRIHITEFCDGFMNAELERSMTTASIQFISRSCGKHNCSDEQCTDYDKIIEVVNQGPGTDRHPLAIWNH